MVVVFVLVVDSHYDREDRILRREHIFFFFSPLDFKFVVEKLTHCSLEILHVLRCTKPITENARTLVQPKHRKSISVLNGVVTAH